jgi:hypothetical protein
MKNLSTKNAYIKTIGYAPWLLVIYSVIFLGICSLERPGYIVLFLSIPFGFYTALILPFLWRRNNDWLGTLLVVMPTVYFSIWRNNHLEAVQIVCAAAAVTTLIWLLFKNKFISYVSNQT